MPRTAMNIYSLGAWCVDIGSDSSVSTDDKGVEEFGEEAKGAVGTPIRPARDPNVELAS